MSFKVLDNFRGFGIESRDENFWLNDGVISEDPTKAKAPTEIRGRMLTIGGSVTLENNAGLIFDITTAQGSHDKLDVLGTLTFEGASVLTITSSGGAGSVTGAPWVGHRVLNPRATTVSRLAI